jgi:hypothetical protein
MELLFVQGGAEGRSLRVLIKKSTPGAACCSSRETHDRLTAMNDMHDRLANVSVPFMASGAHDCLRKHRESAVHGHRSRHLHRPSRT